MRKADVQALYSPTEANCGLNLSTKLSSKKLKKPKQIKFAL